MKKSFFLYFLVLSPLLFSQNFQQSSLINSKPSPVANTSAKSAFPDNELTVIDTNPHCANDQYVLKEPNNLLYTSKISTFSSLLLIEQLQKLDQKTPFQIQHNPTLERYIRVYLKDRRESISNLMDRATYYFPIFEKYLDKYDLPLEIKYLAIVESALKADAVSPSGAKGLWQFMYTTGEEFGLQENSYVDDRFDALKSTEAACKYLSKLYGMFNDWDLALAAYNSGPTNVKKAITRSGGRTNYWEIRNFLPKETQGYLPAFYATYYIFEYAETHKLTPHKSSTKYIETDTIHIRSQLTFSSIRSFIPIKMELLKSLNPQYKREFIPTSSGKQYALTLPAALVSTFIENESLIYGLSSENSENFKYSSIIKVTKNNSHIVQIGENLGRIAKKYHISLTQLKKWNGLQTNFLIEGQRLVVTDKVQKESADESKNSTLSPIISSGSPVDAMSTSEMTNSIK